MRNVLVWDSVAKRGSRIESITLEIIQVTAGAALALDPPERQAAQ